MGQIARKTVVVAKRISKAYGLRSQPAVRTVLG